MVFQNNLLMGAGGLVEGYTIDYSCRFDGSSAYLSKTFGSAGNRKTWTQSVWIKRSGLTAYSYPAMNTDTGGNDGSVMYNDDKFEFIHDGSGAYRDTNMVFRDTSAWYHLVWYFDSTLSASEAVRSKLWVNGVEQTWTQTTTITKDKELQINNNVLHGIGYNIYDGTDFWNGYLAEYVFIDGTALTADSFGKTSSTTGQWIPKDVSELTFGQNGFYLDFADSSDLGNDVSGNNNDWASSNLAASDQTPDTPTLNRAVLNGIQNGAPATAVLSEGNTRADISGTTRIQRSATMPLVGKVYWEVLVNDNSQNTAGIGDETVQDAMVNDSWYNQTTHVAGFDNANLYYNGSYTTYSQPSNTQRWMFAFDADTGEFWSGVNGTWHNSGDPAAASGEVATVSTSVSWFLFVGGKSGADQQLILGSDNMSHTVPSGFTADLNVSQLDAPTIDDPSAYFQTTLYTGDGASSLAVNQGGNSTFDPDFVWIKNRDATDAHCLFDSVRGATKLISSDSTAAQTTDADTLLSFDSDGFSVGADVKVNTSSEKYVGWQWLEGTTSDCDIVSFTGNATGRTISHSLSVVPEFMIVKNLADTDNWAVYHASNTAAPATDYLILNTTAATADESTIWNDTAPTSSVFSVGTSSLTNGNTEAMIAYLFAGVEGFSKFGSYDGNGDANGAFVWCGFKPALIICKSSASTSDWFMFDDQRLGYNVDNNSIFANTNAAELTADNIDILSNGFKMRIATDPNVSESYIYMAWASTPFKTATAR